MPHQSVSVDVAIHCGDLTGDSKLHDFQQAIQLLAEINAPLKLVIAGNHDFSLDDAAFKQKITEANRVAQEDLSEDIKKEYGDYGDARRLFEDEKDPGIIFLDEGSHQFTLNNGALLKVYASPYTPVTRDSSDWGFQYTGVHDFSIEKGTDIVITHGPPQGIFDMARKQRIGCPQLFAAVARAQPRIHCFGHVHKSWGAKLVAWRPEISDHPSHFSDIDHGKSVLVENLSSLKLKQNDTMDRQQRCCSTSHCKGDERPLDQGETLFVNAAVMGDDDELNQYPWLVEIELEGKTCDESDDSEHGQRSSKRKGGLSSGEEEEEEEVVRKKVRHGHAD